MLRSSVTGFLCLALCLPFLAAGAVPAGEAHAPLPKGVVARFGTPWSTAGYKHQIAHIVISPDGHIAATSHEFGICLWDVAKGEELRTIRTSSFPWIAFSPDGKALLSGRLPEGFKVWDVGTGRLIRSLREPPKEMISGTIENGVCQVSPRGSLLAVSSTRKPARELLRDPSAWEEIEFWDWNMGKELRDRRFRVRPTMESLAFSPDGRVLAVGLYRHEASGQQVSLWDVATGRLLQTMGSGYKGLYPLTFSPDGRLLAAAVHRKRTQPRKPKTEEEKSDAMSGRLERGAMRPDQLIVLWEVASGKEVLVLEREDAWSPSMAFSPDGRLLAARGEDREPHDFWLWDARTGAPLHHFKTTEKVQIGHVAFTPDSRRLVTTLYGEALFWDVNAYNRPVPPLPAMPAAALDRLWDDLAAADIKAARKAVWTLVAVPAQSVPLLRDRLRPVPRTAPEQIQQWLADLDSPEFAVRGQARKKLEELGEVAVPAMEKALADKPALEKRRRLQELLALTRRPLTSPARLRVLRALEVLEHVGSAEARAVLRRMAAGAAGAWETEDARAALRRLEGRRAAP